MKRQLSEDKVAGETSQEDDQNGMDAGEVDDAERNDADDDGDDAMGGFVTEVLAVHEQQGGTGNEADHDGAQSAEGSLDGWAVVMPPDPVAGEEHEQKWRQNHGESGDYRAPDTAGDDIADVSGTVDANGAGGHLRDGNDVGKHLAGDPARANHLTFYEREHGIATTETKKSNLQVSPDKF